MMIEKIVFVMFYNGFKVSLLHKKWIYFWSCRDPWS